MRFSDWISDVCSSDLHFDRGRIVCPFHGWRWNLAGANELVLEQQEFRDGKLQPGDVARREVALAVYAGLVFINLGPSPSSSAYYIAPAPPWLDGVAKRRGGKCGGRGSKERRNRG